MNTSLLTKLDDNVRDDLAIFGLVRATALKEAPVSDSKPNFFGVDDRGTEVELLFTKDEKELADAVEDGMDLALVAPENESFNMLVTKDFQKAITGKDPESLRDFLMRILDEV